MKVLNLLDSENSSINYEKRSYPDGQQDIIIKTDWVGPVQISSRFNNFRDLELIICATKALKNNGVTQIHLFIPNILGARSDRKFQKGGTSYLRDVVAPIINAQNYSSVEVIDPHSDVSEAVINNLIKRDNTSLVTFALEALNLGCYESDNCDCEGYTSDQFALISPDAGALKKIYDVAQAIDYKNDVIVASKHRDISTGKILSTQVPLVAGEHTHDTFIIIDDICDGGRTFIEISKVIKSMRPQAKIYLIITHGIFSGGLKVLDEWFDNIFCTNSVKDIDAAFIGHDNVNNGVMLTMSKVGFVKQLNVF